MNRRHNCKKFDSYRWMGQVDVVIYYNGPEQRFEAEVDGKEFTSPDIQKLRAEIDRHLGQLDRTEWKLLICIGHRYGYDYELIYMAKDGAIRDAAFLDGGETEAIETRTMPEIGAIRKHRRIDESAIPFTWEYLEAARFLRKRFAYLKECLDAVADSKNQQAILDAFLADKIAVPERPIVTTDEIGGEDTDLMNMLNEMFDVEMEDDY